MQECVELLQALEDFWEPKIHISVDELKDVDHLCRGNAKDQRPWATLWAPVPYSNTRSAREQAIQLVIKAVSTHAPKTLARAVSL